VTTQTSGPEPLPTGTSLSYRLVLTSDWHPGTGTGRPGDVDQLVNRDLDGLPYLPAKTVTGVWRDACEIVARTLDGGDGGDGPWQGWVTFAFGSQPALSGSTAPPVAAAVSIRAARYHGGVRAALAGDPFVREAITFVKPGVRVDLDTGRATPGMLRFSEQARVGSVLHGTFELTGTASSGGLAAVAPLDDNARRCITALLLAGSRLVEQIGGKRRRGNGRCTLELSSIIDPAPWWDWLDTASPPPPPQPPAVDAAPPAAVYTATPPRRPDAAPAPGWDVARLMITLDDPLLAGGRQLGNQVMGRDHIPGSTLLPVALRRLGPAGQAALLAGHLVVTDATVDVAGERGLPMPRTFGAVKTEPGRIVNRANTDARTLETRKIDGYVAATRPLRRVKPTLSVHTHNSVDDTMQRPTTDAGGGVYTYRALATRLPLVAEIRVRAGLLPAGWVEDLSGSWVLGRSRKDDYGRATVSATSVSPPAPRTRLVDARRIIVWLVSDMILLDERLRPSSDPALLQEALTRELRLPATALKQVGSADGRRSHTFAVTRTESWHTRWCRPRPTLFGLAAGSIVTYDITAGDGRGGTAPWLDPTLVAELETGGLGERRGEGLGQLCIAAIPGPSGGVEDGPEVITRFADTQEPAEKALAARTAPREAAAGAAPGTTIPVGGAGTADTDILSADDIAFIAALRTEAWRAEIARRAVTVASDPDGLRRVFGDGLAAVTPSQLAQLRDILPRLADRVATESLVDRLVDPSRRRSWPDGVGRQLKALLTRPGQVWEALGWDGPAGPTAGGQTHEAPHAATIAADLRKELWQEAVQTLVLTCLTAHRRNREAK
jgi:CRISPR-associated protein Csx10